MKVKHLTPDTLFDSKPYAFSQVVISQGSRLVHISGQTANDRDLNIVGAGDFAAQAKCAFENVGLAVAAAGGKIENIVRINVYVVDYRVELLDMIAKATTDFFGSVPPPASTMVGVQALALPPFLIEIEATAVID
jgi:enamine deaminase RidA (YjgF/YER057c/UK114 family)